MRKFDPGAGQDAVMVKWLNLWWAALAAADETIQGGPLAPAWLRLFEAHLSGSEATMLRWRGHLGESAEVRRAYSGLYGRYFARAVLASELGITNFVPLLTKVTKISGGVTVTRVGRGDLPDWIAWDPVARSHVLCEAKGRLSGSGKQFLRGKPGCIRVGKAQFDKVKVADLGGRQIATRNWIAANLWSTDRVARDPVALLWDPPGEGATLTSEEAEHHARAMRRQRDATVAVRLGNPERRVRIAVSPPDGDTGVEHVNGSKDGPSGSIVATSRARHEGEYMAAVIAPLGDSADNGRGRSTGCSRDTGKRRRYW